jgi:hypothetical protein
LDVFLTPSGDLAVENGDLALADGVQERFQMARCRVLTDAPDWFHHPELGASLSDLFGEPNSEATARDGTERIVSALTYDGYFSPAEVEVEAVPDEEGIHFFVHLAGESRSPIVWQLSLNLANVRVLG